MVVKLPDQDAVGGKTPLLAMDGHHGRPDGMVGLFPTSAANWKTGGHRRLAFKVIDAAILNGADARRKAAGTGKEKTLKYHLNLLVSRKNWAVRLIHLAGVQGMTDGRRPDETPVLLQTVDGADGNGILALLKTDRSPPYSFLTEDWLLQTFEKRNHGRAGAAKDLLRSV